MSDTPGKAWADEHAANWHRRLHPNTITGHAGDCTVYAIPDGDPANGVCTCGYGLQQVRTGDYSQMYSPQIKLPVRITIDGAPL